MEVKMEGVESSAERLSRMELKDLPNELIDKIVRYLGDEDLMAFGRTCLRARSIVYNFTSRLKVTSVQDYVKDFFADLGSNVIELDLSNCFSTSASMEAVIAKCSNLKILCVINSRLGARCLLNVIKKKKSLKVLRFSISVSQVTKKDLSTVNFEPNENLENVYVEVPPMDDYYQYAVGFLNSCLNLTKLHILIVDSILPSDFNWRHTPNNQGIIGADKWQKLQTVIICSEARESAQRLVILIPRLFELSPSRETLFLLTSSLADFKCIVYHQGVVNIYHEIANHVYPIDVQHQNFEIIRKNFFVCLDVSTRAPHPIDIEKYGAPSGVVVSLSNLQLPPPVQRLRPLLTANLLELNLLKCHCRVGGSAWLEAIATATNLQSLAIPACYLPNTTEDSHAVVVRSKRVRVANSWDPEACPVIKVLSTLPLRELHIHGDKCRFCIDVSQRPKIMGRIERLTKLTTLVLIDVPILGPLLEIVYSPILTTLKICSVGRPSACQYIYGLRGFLEKSRSLRNLKLSHENLALTSKLLWDSFLASSSLRQLCIASGVRDKVDVGNICLKLSQLKLEQAHIHAQPVNFRVLEATLSATFQRVSPKTQVIVNDANHFASVVPDVRYPQAGRSVCFEGNFIAHPKPYGWEYY